MSSSALEGATSLLEDYSRRVLNFTSGYTMSKVSDPGQIIEFLQVSLFSFVR